MSTSTITMMLNGITSGQTLHAQLFQSDGITTIGSPITTGFVDMGADTYSWTFTVDVGTNGIYRVYDASNDVVNVGLIRTVDGDDCHESCEHTVAQEFECPPLPTSFNTHEVLIVRGDDYTAANNRALLFKFSGLPDLAGSTLTLTATSYVNGSTAFTVNGAFKDTAFVSGSHQTNFAKVAFELTHTQTSALNVGYSAYSFTIQATLPDTSVYTLGKGLISVQ